jgi:predicted unusual protein kinase regulating ubiquinone biosynthesis (AarF/ABC1/UbiB family)
MKHGGQSIGIKISPENLKRYKDIGLLLFKYGNSDLVKYAGIDQAMLAETTTASTEAPAKATELATDLEKMGPAFVKLGQLLSTRPDFLPPIYIDALSRLQDNCEPFAFAEVEKTIVNELGVRLSKAFSQFNQVPVAAASLGQIHHAVMRDGREVAIKVQRPGIRESIIQDLQILGDIADFYDAHTEAGQRYEYGLMLEEFSKSILAELDYRKEAHNLETMKANLQAFELIVVPAPINDFSSSKVLTMEFIHGKKITNVTALELLEIDGEALAEEAFEAYLQQILVDGFFHADPHPGNVLLTSENKIGLLDLGMVAHLTPSMQSRLLQLILAISEGRADAVADTAIDIGTRRANFDEVACRKKIADLVQDCGGANIEQMQIGRVVLDITRAAGDCGIRVPSELTMLGKTLLNLDQVGRTLYPAFDPNASVRRHAAKIMQQRMFKDISPGHMFTSILEAKNFAEKFPSHINKILDLAASNKLSIKVIDEPLLVDAFQKLANRVSLALILAALIVGAALLMQVSTRFTIFGYPGLAILCFIAAAGGGIAMAIEIAFYDQRPQKFGSDTTIRK